MDKKLLDKLDRRTKAIQLKIAKRSSTELSRVVKIEQQLLDRLQCTDSLKAQQLERSLTEANNRVKRPGAPSVYLRQMDSLQTALQFLQANIPTSPQIAKVLKSQQQLQNQLNYAEQVNKLLKQKCALLESELKSAGMVKELKQLKVQAYYYHRQIGEYKEMLKDGDKLQKKLLSAVRDVPAFKKFFDQHSQFASLFPSQPSGSNMVSNGLQTRASVEQILVSQFGPNGMGDLLKERLSAAQTELNKLRNKADQWKSGSTGNGEPDLPEGFRPNNQKTKPVFQRLEIGFNLQSQGSRYAFPVTTDFGFSVGYKLTDNKTIGVGLSYKMGWGSSWDKIRISTQGIGLRSFLDMRLKGSFYLSGGYEMNYYNQMNTTPSVHLLSSWQQSGLMGLMKKIHLSGSVKGDVRLLWDFLSYQQVPRTQAVVFRIGYTIK